MPSQMEEILYNQLKKGKTKCTCPAKKESWRLPQGPTISFSEAASLKQQRNGESRFMKSNMDGKNIETLRNMILEQTKVDKWLN
jgi:hypothetical protein